MRGDDEDEDAAAAAATPENGAGVKTRICKLSISSHAFAFKDVLKCIYEGLSRSVFFFKNVLNTFILPRDFHKADNLPLFSSLTLNVFWGKPDRWRISAASWTGG